MNALSIVQTHAAAVNLWSGATFLPHDNPSRSDLLLQKVRDARQAAFLAFSLKTLAAKSVLCRETDFLENFNRFKNAAPNERQRLIESPTFLAWFKQTLRREAGGDSIKENLSELSRIINAAFAEDTNAAQLIIADRSVEVRRYEIEPLIAEAACPEYNFPDAKRRSEFDKAVVYPEKLFLNLLTVALERIKTAWYEAYCDFPKFVRAIVDMIDGDFTSYSAASHTGVIFVSTDNSPLVALEEFLIHEFGHQILYNVMELDPIVIDDGKQTIYKLPWSGNERDFYGYFHAFYIYIFIARYLERCTNRSQREQRRIADRFAHIVRGLRKAVPTFESSANFTERGRELFENLKKEVCELERSFQRKISANN